MKPLGYVTKRSSEPWTQLDVGSGINLTHEWVALDKNNECDIWFDLETCTTTKIPLPDNTFERINCSHVLEHITNILPVMQELHRIIIPDGEILIKVPHGASNNADEDPTHVRRFFEDSCGYFSQAAYKNADYNYRGDWQTVERVLVLKDHEFTRDCYSRNDLQQLHSLILMTRNLVEEMQFLLKAIKPIRKPSEAHESAPISFLAPWTLNNKQH